MTTEGIQAELDAEPATMTDVITVCRELRDDLKRYDKRLDKIDRRNTRGLIVGALLSTVAIVVGLFVLHTLNAYLNDRDSARISSCINSNVAIKADRVANLDGLLSLVPGADLTTDAGREATIARLAPPQLKSYNDYADAQARQKPYRDCSPRGIKIFLGDPPEDPALEN